jgi:hypothetical protein
VSVGEGEKKMDLGVVSRGVGEQPCGEARPWYEDKGKVVPVFN